MPVKITDLDTATTITANDFIQIIDVDDRTMSPVGTNRKITASNAANQLANLITSIPPVMVTALSTKANLINPTFTGNVALPNTTAIGPVNSAEIGYLTGVNNNIQVQLDLKAPRANPIFRTSEPSPLLTTQIGVDHGLHVYNDNAKNVALCGVSPVIRSFGIGGTVAVPTATADASNIGGLYGFAYNGTSFNGYGFGGVANIGFTTKGAQTTSNGGGYITFATTQQNTINSPQERVRIDHNGNVGIGTASPSNTLHVSGNEVIARFSGTTNEYQGIVIQPTQSSASVAKGGFIDFKNENDIALTTLTSYHYTDGGSDLLISATPVGSRTVNRRNEIMRIKGNGNVGIGTNNPQTKLHAFGGAETLRIESSTNQLYVPLVTSEGLSNRVEICNRAGGRFAVYNEQVGDGFNILKNGNVGIGTNNPGVRLAVASNSSQYDVAINVIESTHATSKRAAVLLGSWNIGQSLNGNTSRDFYVYDDRTRMEISPSTSTDPDNVRFRNAANANQYWFYNRSNGAGVTSDERTKNTIQKLDTAEALQYINRISPSTFISNGDTELQAGFIAQDLLENATTSDQKTVVHNHKTYNKNNPDCPILGVADRPIVAYLVAAMKEQQKMINDLQTRLEILENKDS